MHRVPTMFLRVTIVLLGLLVCAVCIYVLPMGIQTDKVGYYQPILLGMYVTVVPFVFALSEALKLLGYIDEDKVFYLASVRRLRNIKYAALIISALYAAGMPYIYYAADRDDAPGVVAIGLVIMFASLVIATATAVFQSLVERAVGIKSENDLTV